MIHFFSSHTDTSFLQEYFKGEEITIIPHPHLDQNWSVSEIREHCRAEIGAAIAADILIANGDYTLVGMILLERSRLGKKTGFFAMKKMNRTEFAKPGSAGQIEYKNIVRPVGIRWL